MDSEFLMELIFHLVANMQVGNLSKFHVTILKSPRCYVYLVLI